MPHTLSNTHTRPLLPYARVVAPVFHLKEINAEVKEMNFTLTWSVEVLWCLRQRRCVVVSAVHRGADGALAGGSLHDAFSNVITALIHSTQ